MYFVKSLGSGLLENSSRLGSDKMDLKQIQCDMLLPRMTVQRRVVADWFPAEEKLSLVVLLFPSIKS